jgi:DNA-binding MarR family transcriptional regulator
VRITRYLERMVAFEHCINLELRKSARLITQFYESRLSEVGLKVGQFSILRAVYLCKQTNNKELQRILVLDQTTLSRNLKPLIRDELLNLSLDENDHRVKLITLSDKGRKTYQTALPLWQAAQKEISNKLGKQHVEQITELTDKLLETLNF